MILYHLVTENVAEDNLFYIVSPKDIVLAKVSITPQSVKHGSGSYTIYYVYCIFSNKHPGRGGLALMWESLFSTLPERVGAYIFEGSPY